MTTNVLGGGFADNAILANNASLYSANGIYQAKMQVDGNFVLYDNSHGHTAIWSSHTAGIAAGGFLEMQDDGNLVVYTKGSQAVWGSGTGDLAQNGRPFALALKDNGTLVVDDTLGATWSPTASYAERWSNVAGRETTGGFNAPDQYQTYADASYQGFYQQVYNAHLLIGGGGGGGGGQHGGGGGGGGGQQV